MHGSKGSNAGLCISSSAMSKRGMEAGRLEGCKAAFLLVHLLEALRAAKGDRARAQCPTTSEPSRHKRKCAESSRVLDCSMLPEEAHLHTTVAAWRQGSANLRQNRWSKGIGTSAEQIR